MSNLSYDSFNYNKRYAKVKFQYRRHLMDNELDELQDIANAQIGDNMEQLYSTEGVTYGLEVQENTGDTANKVKVLTGFVLKYNVDNQYGFLVLRIAEQVVTGFTTPGALRTDTLYLDVYKEEIDSTEDANIINPYETVETSRREKLVADFAINEGASGPPAVVPSGHAYIELARITRGAGDANINTADISETNKDYATLRISYNDLQDLPLPPDFSIFVQSDDPSGVAGGSNDIDQGDIWFDTTGGTISQNVAKSDWLAGAATDWWNPIDDTAYAGSWNAVTDQAPTKNAVYDTLSTHYANASAHHVRYADSEAKAACVSDTAYGAGWNAVTDVAPSKNAVYDTLNTHYADADAHHNQSHNIESTSDHNITGSFVTGSVPGYRTGDSKFHPYGIQRRIWNSGGGAYSTNADYIAAFDVVLDRRDFVSNALAGTALKAALEDATVKSIFVKGYAPHQYFEIGATVTQASSQDVVFEPGTIVDMTAAGTYINVGTGCTIRNMFVAGGDTAGSATRGLVYKSADNAVLINCRVSASAGYGFAGATSSEEGGLFGCESLSAAYGGFYRLSNLVNCISDSDSDVVARGGFQDCAHLEGCVSHDSGGAGFDTCNYITACYAYQCDDAGFNDCFQLSSCYSYNNDQGYNGCNDMAACRASINTRDGFKACVQIAGCTAYDNTTDGFDACSNLSGCLSDINGVDGYVDCNRVSGCAGDGNSQFDFHGGDYYSACWAGSGGWNGSFSYKDNDSCN